MDNDSYRLRLEVDELIGELKRLIVVQRNADRLICRYLADLADGLAAWPFVLLAYGDASELARRNLDLSKRAIRERIRVGRALRDLPAIEEALASGELNYSRVREVTRVAEPATERSWLQLARTVSMRQLEKRVVSCGLKSMRGKNRQRYADGNSGGGCQLLGTLERVLPREVWDLLVRALRCARRKTAKPFTNVQALTAVIEAALRELMADAPVNPNLDQAAIPGPHGEARYAGANDCGDGTCGWSLVDNGLEVESAATQSGSGVIDGVEVDGRGRAGESVATQSGSGVIDGVEVDGRGRAGESVATQSAVAGADGRESIGASVTTQSGLGVTGGPTWPTAEDLSTQMGATATTATRCPHASAGSQFLRSVARANLSQDALALFDMIAKGGVWTLATLCDASDLSPSRVASGLTELELEKCVVRDWCGVLQAVLGPGGAGCNEAG